MRYPLIFPEAMACRNFCVNLGRFIDGETYIDKDMIICTSPSIWEIHITGWIYSCHIRGENYHFEKGYKIKWLVEDKIPKDFSLLISRAYEYNNLHYPKLKILAINA